MPVPRLLATRALVLGALAAAALVGAAAVPASAAEGDAGWVRVAHLSPDTSGMDVRLARIDGAGDVVRIPDVAYGAVSSYRALPVGTYAVAMRPAGSNDSAPPVVQASVQVTAGSAKTVAVFGRNADLRPKVITDSLALPKDGSARVRVVQASTAADPATVTAASDTRLVGDAATGTVSKYSDVPAGPWKVAVEIGGTTDTSTVDLTAGQVASLFVLDDADGGTVVRSVVDAASVGGVPKGFLATGGGYLEHAAEQRTATTTGLAAGGVLLAAAGAALVVRRRRTRA